MFESIKNKIVKSLSNVCISAMKKKSPVIKELFDNPENLKVEAYIEKEEIIVRIKAKEL